MSKKIVDLRGLIREAMADDNSFMPYRHSNGVSIDTFNHRDGEPLSVEGYWVAPDTGERYYIAAEITIQVTDFEFSPPDDYWDEDDEEDEDV